MIAEQFIRHSDNQIRMTLTEDNDPLIGNWLTVDIYFGGVHLHRDVSEDGVILDQTSGLLTIVPGDLTSDEKTAIDELDVDSSHRVQIVITSILNDDGAVFGGTAGGIGADPIFFFISDMPS